MDDCVWMLCSQDRVTVFRTSVVEHGEGFKDDSMEAETVTVMLDSFSLVEFGKAPGDVVMSSFNGSLSLVEFSPVESGVLLFLVTSVDILFFYSFEKAALLRQIQLPLPSPSPSAMFVCALTPCVALSSGIRMSAPALVVLACGGDSPGVTVGSLLFVSYWNGTSALTRISSHATVIQQICAGLLSSPPLYSGSERIQGSQQKLLVVVAGGGSLSTWTTTIDELGDLTNLK
jgi:hypothetical protein